MVFWGGEPGHLYFGDIRVFIAMNRFKTASGSEEAFEKLRRDRDRYLDGVPGFKSIISFVVLRMQVISYMPHIVNGLQSKISKIGTTSKAFQQAHEGSGDR